MDLIQIKVHEVFVAISGNLQGQVYNELTSSNIYKPDNAVLQFLLTEIYYRTVKKYLSGRYDGYPISILLSYQVKDVCAHYVKGVIKEKNNGGDPLLAICKNFSDPNPTILEKLESIEELKNVEGTMDEDLQKIFKLREDKVPHKEIARILGTTEEAIKMKIYRWRKNNKKKR